MNVLNKMFGSAAAAAPAKIPVAAKGAPMKLSYRHSVNRQHLDETPHQALLLVHDYGLCGATLNNFMTSLAMMPGKGMPLVCPLEVFVPDMRGHGRSPKLNGTAGVSEHVNDLLYFANNTIDQTLKIHVVGFGWGGLVAAAAARSDPSRFVSLGAVNFMPPALNPDLRNAASNNLELAAAHPTSPTLKALDESLAAKVKNPLARTQMLLGTTTNMKENRVEWAADVANLHNSLDAAFAWPSELADANECARIPTTVITDKAFSASELERCQQLFHQQATQHVSEWSLNVMTGEAAEFAVQKAMVGAGLLAQ